MVDYSITQEYIAGRGLSYRLLIWDDLEYLFEESYPEHDQAEDAAQEFIQEQEENDAE